MKKSILHQYKNGNTNVTIFSDGTKIRKYDFFSSVVHPESLDVKITNFCDIGCAYCHEKSTKNGKHADLNVLLKILSPLPAGVEIALGGGNPLSHPDLLVFLKNIKNKGLIANITINQKHILPYYNLIVDLIKEQLINGIGISYNSSFNDFNNIKNLLNISDNIVFHVIMGINDLSDISTLYDICNSQNKICKILILGYKEYGFGIKYFKSNFVEQNKIKWFTLLSNFFKKEKLLLSFDNLAIEQLKLKRFFNNADWNKFYMGNDFTYTMYIDAIEQQYAPTSISNNRKSFYDYNLIEYFQTYKKTG